MMVRGAMLLIVCGLVAELLGCATVDPVNKPSLIQPKISEDEATRGDPQGYPVPQDRSMGSHQGLPPTYGNTPPPVGSDSRADSWNEPMDDRGVYQRPPFDEEGEPFDDVKAPPPPPRKFKWRDRKGGHKGWELSEEKK